jgi:predicted transcriptional regulator
MTGETTPVTPFDEQGPLWERQVGPLPDEIESSDAKLVYLALQMGDGHTVSDLARLLQMKSIALYPIVRSLSEKGLVDRDGETVRCT